LDLFAVIAFALFILMRALGETQRKQNRRPQPPVQRPPLQPPVTQQEQQQPLPAPGPFPRDFPPLPPFIWEMLEEEEGEKPVAAAPSGARDTDMDDFKSTEGFGTDLARVPRGSLPGDGEEEPRQPAWEKFNTGQPLLGQLALGLPLGADDLLRSVVMAEVLGPPRARRRLARGRH